MRRNDHDVDHLRSNPAESGRKPDIQETMSRLEERGRKLCSNLRSLRIDRSELTREAELLSQEIERAREGLGLKLSSGKDDGGDEDSLENKSREIDETEERPKNESESEISNRTSTPNVRTVSSSTVDAPCRFCGVDHVHSNLTLYGTEADCKVERSRGGVDFPVEHSESAYSIECSCSCTLCTLRNSIGCDPGTIPFPREEEIEPYDDINPPPEIAKMCKVEKLVETLEHVKNRNHSLKKLLKNCSCVMDHPELANRVCGKSNGEPRENVNHLIAMVKVLQQKCRTKDGMILALADELRRRATFEQTSRILENLAKPDLNRRANDFDRATLWRYLNGKTMLEPTTRRKYYTNCSKETIIGVILLILILVPALFRICKYIGPKIGFAIGYVGHLIHHIFFKYYLPLRIHETFLQWVVYVCKVLFTIVKFLSTVLNGYYIPLYFSSVLNYELEFDFIRILLYG